MPGLPVNDVELIERGITSVPSRRQRRRDQEYARWCFANLNDARSRRSPCLATPLPRNGMPALLLHTTKTEQT
jgi:hypothetical protein